MSRARALAPSRGNAARPAARQADTTRTQPRAKVSRLAAHRAQALLRHADGDHDHHGGGSAQRAGDHHHGGAQRAGDHGGAPATGPTQVIDGVVVSSPKAAFEREAAAVAARVVGGQGPPPAISAVEPGGLLRCPGGCGPIPCDHRKRDPEALMRAEAPARGQSDHPTGTAGPSGGGAARRVGDVLSTPGAPLAPSARALFEPRFGHDFSAVRVHTDGRAAAAAASVGARAFTVGSHIVFGDGQHDVGSATGRLLLAHELTHVVQQGGTGPRPAAALGGGLPLMRQDRPQQGQAAPAQRTAEQQIAHARAAYEQADAMLLSDVDPTIVEPDLFDAVEALGRDIDEVLLLIETDPARVASLGPTDRRAMVNFLSWLVQAFASSVENLIMASRAEQVEIPEDVSNAEDVEDWLEYVIEAGETWVAHNVLVGSAAADFVRVYLGQLEQFEAPQNALEAMLTWSEDVEQQVTQISEVLAEIRSIEAQISRRRAAQRAVEILEWTPWGRAGRIGRGVLRRIFRRPRGARRAGRRGGRPPRNRGARRRRRRRRTIEWCRCQKRRNPSLRLIRWPLPVWKLLGHGDTGALSPLNDMPPRAIVRRVTSPTRNRTIVGQYVGMNIGALGQYYGAAARSTSPCLSASPNYQSPGCIHHKWPLYLGGPDSIANLVFLLPPEHAAVHAAMARFAPYSHPVGTRYCIRNHPRGRRRVRC